ncbi:MAG TPA: hypothetical protein VFY71_12160 [Planctomycetota bacterium]|nr:hypothetical protein [Planctomycetota bacterium]
MTAESALEPAHAFGGFIGPRTLVGLVRTAAPYLFDGLHPRVAELPRVPDDGARLHALAFHPLGWWSILLHAERLPARERPAPADVSDYFALCLAAHWGSVASYVPTDVDAKIRNALWLDQTDPQELATMRALAAQLARWDVRGFSARLVDVEAASGEAGHGLHSGHDGERLAVLCGALGAHRARGEEATATELEDEIEAELAREARAFAALRRAAGRARPGDTSAGVAFLRLASVLAHNAGDLNQGLAGHAGRKAGPAAAARFGELLQRDPRRHGGAFAQAGIVYRALLAAEGHRNYPLREVRALRERAELLLPIGPCLDAWGAALARHPGWTASTRAEVVEALVAGCRKVPGQSGYYRALAGLDAALPGGLSAPGVGEHCSAATRRGLKEAELRRRVAVPRVSFESGLVSMARRLLDGAAG